MKHEFDKVAILCTTDEQIQHLETMVKTFDILPMHKNGYSFMYFRFFPTFHAFSNSVGSGGKPVVTYEEFIAGMQETETQVVEVTGCERCPLVDSYDEYVLCNHPTPSNTQTTSFIEKFSSCPLKKGAVTIKLKEQ